MLALASAGMFTLWGAVLVDVGSAIAVMLNGLWLMRWRWQPGGAHTCVSKGHRHHHSHHGHSHSTSGTHPKACCSSTACHAESDSHGRDAHSHSPAGVHQQPCCGSSASHAKSDTQGKESCGHSRSHHAHSHNIASPSRCCSAGPVNSQSAACCSSPLTDVRPANQHQHTPQRAACHSVKSSPIKQGASAARPATLSILEAEQGTKATPASCSSSKQSACCSNAAAPSPRLPLTHSHTTPTEPLHTPAHSVSSACHSQHSTPRASPIKSSAGTGSPATCSQAMHQSAKTPPANCCASKRAPCCSKPAGPSPGLPPTQSSSMPAGHQHTLGHAHGSECEPFLNAEAGNLQLGHMRSCCSAGSPGKGCKDQAGAANEHEPIGTRPSAGCCAPKQGSCCAKATAASTARACTPLVDLASQSSSRKPCSHGNAAGAGFERGTCYESTHGGKNSH